MLMHDYDDDDDDDDDVVADAADDDDGMDGDDLSHRYRWGQRLQNLNPESQLRSGFGS